MTLTHGLSKSHPLYPRWEGMRARCNNPAHASYARYGGRGISVCPRWDDFAAFVEDMGPSWPGEDFELHRLDGEEDYHFWNCIWILRAEHRAMPKPAQHRAKISAAHTGQKRSPEHAASNGKAHRAKIDLAWLREAYQERGLSIAAIAVEAGCGKSSVHRALHRHGIKKASA